MANRELSIRVGVTTGNSASQLKALSVNIKNIKSDFNNAGAGIKNFEKTTQGLSAKIKMLSETMKALTDKQTILKKQIQETENTFKTLESKINTTKSTIKQFSDGLKNAENNLKTAKNETLQLTAKLNEEGKALRDVSKALLDSKTKYAENEHSIKTLSNSITEQKEKISTLKNELKSVSSEYGKNSVEAKKLATEIRKQEREYNRLKNQLRESKQLQSTYKAEVERLTVEYNKQKEKVRDLSTQLKEAKTEYGNCSDQVKQLQKSMESANKELEKQEKALISADNRLVNLSTQLNNVEAEFKNLNKELKETERALKGANFKKFGEDMTKIGDKTLKASKKIKDVGRDVSIMSTAFIGGFGASVATAANFEKEMDKVQAISRASGEDMKKLEETARQWGKSTSFSASEAAQGLQFMALAGWDTNQMVNGLGPVLRAAEAGNMDLARASDLVTDSMGALGKEVSELGNYLDVMSLAQNISNMSLEQGLEAMIKVGGQAQTLGIPLTELAANLGVMADNGNKGTVAGNKLNSIITRMTAQSKPAAKAWEGIGVSVFDANGKFRGLTTVLSETKEALANATEEEQAFFLKTVVGTQNVNDFKFLLEGTNGKVQEYTDKLNNSNGALEEMAKTMKDNLLGRIENMKGSLEEAAISIGNKMMPVIEKVVDWITKLADKFASLNPETQEFIIKAGLIAAVLGPAILLLGNLVMVFGAVTKGVGLVSKGIGKCVEWFGKLGGKATEAGGKLNGLKGKFTSLSGIASNPYLLVGALVALGAAIGESEKGILMLQEKFGSLGLVFGGVCEFISGLWQLTIGGILNMTTLIFDVIAALIDGPGGQTVSEAWKRYNAKQDLTLEEGLSKLALSTTRGMSQLRHLQDSELNVMIDSLRTALNNIPMITDENYKQAAQNMATSLTAMNSNQLLALTNLNDTTRMLFSGIREGMTIDEIVPILTGNFEQIKNSGKINTEQMSQDVQSAMETVKNQLDSKTAEGASAVDSNMAQAESAMNSATSTMASSASTGMAQVAGNMIDESGKIPPQIQSNMEQSTSTIQNALSNMAKNIEKSFNDLCYNAEHYLGRIISKSRELSSALASAASSISSSCASMRSSVSSAASSIVSDWNRVVSTLSRKVSGSVSIQKTITTKEVAEKASLSIPDEPNIPMTRDVALSGNFYNSKSPRFNFVEEAVKVKNGIEYKKNSKKQSNNEIDYEKLASILTESIVTAFKEGLNIEFATYLDSRQLAKSVAKYVDDEIKVINKRQQRLGGGL